MIVWFKRNMKRFLISLGIDIRLRGGDRSGKIKLFGKPFYYHHWDAFHVTKIEILDREIYRINTTRKHPVIIDCGANLGLSLLFFSKHYPQASIYAFEPDQAILGYLKMNIDSFGLTNVTLFEKAVWDKNGYCEFFTDNFLGGRLEEKLEGCKPIMVETIRLKDFIGSMHVDLLKLDIEGAELRVVKDCEPVLNQVDNIFVEYHSIQHEKQTLDIILSILQNNGFRYHLSESFSRRRPFIDRNLVADNMEMTINIFGYKI